MYAEVFKRLALTGNGTSEVSQAVAMSGANAAQFDLVVASLTSGATVTAQLQESNDLENWTNKTPTSAPTAVGYTLGSSITAINTGYVRLKITLSGTSPIAVISAGINTAQL